MSVLRWFGPLAVFLCALIGGSVAPRAQGGAPVVIVASPLAKKVARWDEYTGRFEAIEQVDVRPRVSGYIDKLNFTDGQMVHKGDALFTIDPRPYQIAVDQARTDVDRTRAQVTLTTLEYQRGEKLVTTSAVPVSDLDQRRANMQTAIAQAQSAEAALRNAVLNLEWTEVRAPIDGRVSDRKVSVGNLVTGGQGDTTLLTSIVSLDPIHFIFEASEADYLRYARLANAGERMSSRDSQNPAQVRLADETEWTRTGRMNFVDNQINARSGTIRGRAVFDNKDLFLTPGTFGRIRLYGGVINAMLIPDEAVSSDQASKVVFLVGPDSKIIPRPVTLGGISEGLRVVTSGLKSDDHVVISGLANPFVRPGAVVEARSGEIKTASP